MSEQSVVMGEQKEEIEEESEEYLDVKEEEEADEYIESLSAEDLGRESETKVEDGLGSSPTENAYESREQTAEQTFSRESQGLTYDYSRTYESPRSSYDSAEVETQHGTKDYPMSYSTANYAEEKGEVTEPSDENKTPPKAQPTYAFSSEGPKSVESLYSMIEPDREVGFSEEIELLNKQLENIQHEICLEHKERQIKKVRKFQFEKKLIQSAISEAGILYLPGNFLEPITGRRVEDKDIPDILEALKEIPEAELKGFNFAYNNLTDEGIAIIATFVNERPSIVHLNLSHNDFTGSGLHNLVTQLIGRASLQTLKLTGVKVGDEGIDSVTCLYMCGKGPRDLDISETDMTGPGFQALCTAFQAADDDEDYPKFLTKYKLPFSLETLARLKIENHEFLKSQTYHRLCHSQFELIPSREMEHSRIDMANQQQQQENDKQKQSGEQNVIDEGLSKALETVIGALLGGGDGPPKIDLSGEAEMSIEIHEKAKKHPNIDDFIEVHKGLLQEKGCKPTQPDGRPVIICPSLYSLEVDEFDDSGDAIQEKGTHHLKKANPTYMDTLVEHTDEIDTKRAAGRDAVDTLTAQKSSVKFIREVFKEAGTIAGMSEYPSDSDRAQLLLMTILQTAKAFLEAETEGESGDLTLPELKLIWEHSLETTSHIFRPAIPAQCKITDGALDIFVEEFMKISSGTFYNLIQVPFFQDMFESAATKGCIEFLQKKGQLSYSSTQNDTSYYDCVQNVILKFLEGVIARATEIVGGGDPYNFRRSSPTSDDDKISSIGQDQWPSIMDLTEDRVSPLVDQLFEAGGMLARDALACKEEDEAKLDQGIEPAKMYLEGIFKQLTNFLNQLKNDDKKMAERKEKLSKKFTFSTKPVRLVINRPLFKGEERILASKLSNYLMNNESVQCLHCRKWGLGEDGTINLMNGITSNMNIVTLDLSLNGMGSEGALTIGKYMKLNQNLRHLLLNHNRLRNPGMIALAGAIPESSLISLNVACNDSNEGGLNPLLEAIAKSSLYSLYIMGNCFSQTTCSLLFDLFETKTLSQPACDVQVQDIDGEKIVGANSQARDINEWYEVPVRVDAEFICPPYYSEHYTPPRVSIFGAVDVEV